MLALLSYLKKCFLLFSYWQEKGDLGLVAKASRSSQSMMRKPDALTIRKVFNTFRLIAKVCCCSFLNLMKLVNSLFALLLLPTTSSLSLWVCFLDINVWWCLQKCTLKLLDYTPILKMVKETK